MTMTVQSPPAPPGATAQRLVCRTLGPAYAAFGVLHLAATARFMPIMPDWVPWPWQVIQLTGLCEIAGGLGLLVPALRRGAGLGLALYAVCVFPANLHHAFDGVTVPGLPSSWWYHAPRLALQPVLVWLALVAAGLARWPGRNGWIAPWTRPARSWQLSAAIGEPGMVKADYWDVTDEQVIDKTGQPIAHWIGLLDSFGARDKPSKAAVELLQNQHGVPRYWARTLTTHYLKQAG